MKSEINTKLITLLHLIIKKKIAGFTLMLAVILQLSACNNSTDKNTENKSTFTNVVSETTSNVISDTAAIKIIEANDVVLTENDELTSFLNDFDERFYAYASFYDFDLDGHNELFYASDSGIGRSFSTVNYEIYTLKNKVPEFYGYVRLEITQYDDDFFEHTFCKGKLQRYFDLENKVYTIIGDETQWDDGSFGQLQYYSNKYSLYSDKVVDENIGEFSGTYCILTDDVKKHKIECIQLKNTMDFYNFPFESNYCYYNGVFDLDGTDKFIDISEAVSRLEFVDEIDLSSLERYTDIDEIKDKIEEYSGYESNNTVISPIESREYVEINGEKVRKDTTTVRLSFNDVSNVNFKKLGELKKLEILTIKYLGDEEINLDLTPLQNCKHLTSILISENISVNTNQLNEFVTFQYIGIYDKVITCTEDLKYIKNWNEQKYIAINSTSNDPNYFEFLYDNKAVEWIRFDKDVTAEQILNVIDNMPNVKAVTFGFSEV